MAALTPSWGCGREALSSKREHICLARICTRFARGAPPGMLPGSLRGVYRWVDRCVPLGNSIPSALRALSYRRVRRG